MIKSMTGFASLSRDGALAGVSVTVRSVNHRYLDPQVRLPGAFGDLEARIKNRIQAHVARGRVELFVGIQSKQTTSVIVEINEQVLEEIVEALAPLRQRGIIQGQLAVGDIVSIPHVLSVRDRLPEAGTPPELAEMVLAMIDAALGELDTMRLREGRYLGSDLEDRRRALARLVDQLASAAEEGRQALQHRLLERARELAEEFQIEATIVAQEVVRAAARSDISEEVVRLRSHLHHWRALADAPEPCGRKLDFLLQEMNREINTIGSKIEGVIGPDLVLDAKAELEKMREQVQNVE